MAIGRADFTGQRANVFSVASVCDAVKDASNSAQLRVAVLPETRRVGLKAATTEKSRRRKRRGRAEVEGNGEWIVGRQKRKRAGRGPPLQEKDPFAGFGERSVSPALPE